MSEKSETYYAGHVPDKKTNRLWPLYGAGLENFGKNDLPIEVPFPTFSADELLVRHDACGLCFSDIKVIRLGEDHPRIYRNMREDPVVLGHEIVMTVVGVGANLQGQYEMGDRFILQADIFVDGVGYAYGYEIQGGLSQYNVIDQRILNGDHGNYLIPIKKTTGYAEAALVEPWACVIAAYYLQYRTGLQDQGTAWFVGPEKSDFSISSGFDANSHPSKVVLTDMNGDLGERLRTQAKLLGIKIIEMDSIAEMPDEPDTESQADDIILLSPSADLIERISPYLTYKGILAFTDDQKLVRKVNIDVGRIHYNRWLFVGGKERDISALYSQTPVRSKLKHGGRALFVGAGGPMGRMHVQHAIETSQHPGTIVCSDVSNERLASLENTFGAEALEKKIDMEFVNPMEKDAYQKSMEKYKDIGFDDIIMLAPIPAVISDAARWLAPNGVMNIFAGVARGATALLDLNNLIFNDVRIIGHSASAIEDMLTMLNQVETGQLSTNRSVAAVGSLEAAKDGLQALIDAKYPGKVVIFPNINPLPLTSVLDLKDALPDVHAKLKNGCEWTKEAEKTFIEKMID